MDSEDTKFGKIWLPELENLLYIKDKKRDDSQITIGMDFFDKYDAIAAYEEYVAKWNRGSVNLTFVEEENTYEILCYQDPKKSHSKTGLCLYKDSLGRNGIFLKERVHIKESGLCKISIYYKDPKTGYKNIGMPLEANTKIMPADRIQTGSYEHIIRELSKK